MLKQPSLIARKSALEKTQLSDVLITDNSAIKSNYCVFSKADLRAID